MNDRSPAPRHEAASRIVFLDGLRGLAVLIVFLVHSLDQVSPAFVRFRTQSLQLGNVGVMVFFMCSGFIIPATMERHSSLRRFWIGRVWRLFPLYWISVAIGAGFAALGLAELPSMAAQPLLTILGNLTMTQLFLGVSYINGIFWTLELELVLYIAVSLVWALGILRHTSLVAGILLVTSALCDIVFPQVTAASPVLGYLIYVALMWVAAAAYRYHSGAIGRAELCILALLALVALLAPLVPYGLQGLSPYAVARLIGFLLTAALFLYRDHPTPLALRWLGTVSYSVYLLHTYIIVFGHSLPPFVALPLWLGVTLVLSAATERWIEQPGIRIGRRMLSSSKGQPNKPHSRASLSS